MSNQVTGYDLTLSAANISIPQVIEFLHEWAKKWVFQLEEGGTTGYRHYQVRLHLIVKRRLNEIIAQTAHLWPDGTSKRWSITSDTVHKGQNFNYVMKADTRVDGPFNDKDYEAPPPMTRQLTQFKEKSLHGWQEQCLEFTKEIDDRHIKLIYDDYGNAGKSIFAECLEYDGQAYEIPAFSAMEDIMQCVMGVKPKKAYLIDMPRGMKKDKMAGFYAGIESLKNGVAYDKRYAFKKIRFDRPQILVFTNVLPDFGLCSLDRWQVYNMQEDKTLIDQTQEFIGQWREQRRRAARRAERKRARDQSSDDSANE